jgi:hypothetical protein
MTRAHGIAALACAAVILTPGCDRTVAGGATESKGILLDRTEMNALHDRISSAIATPPSKVMTGTGIAGALGAFATIFKPYRSRPTSAVALSVAFRGF